MHYWGSKEKGGAAPCRYPVKEQEKTRCHMLKCYQFKTITLVCDPYELLLYALSFLTKILIADQGMMV